MTTARVTDVARREGALRFLTVLVVVVAAALVGCGGDGGGDGSSSPEPDQDQAVVEAAPGIVAASESFVEAFYAFDTDTLGQLFVAGSVGEGVARFYQGWAEGANYVVVEREPCSPVTQTWIRCSVTVEDDLVNALGIAENVTDQFTLKFDQDGKINELSLVSDDSEEFRAARDFVFENHSELFSQECSGFMADGPTPQKCAQRFVALFEAFAASDAAS